MNENNFDDALIELFVKSREMYGDKIDTFWFFDGDLCPSCNKRKIDAVVMGKESSLSVNGFMYHDMNTLIGYFLCSYCVTNLFAKGDKQKDLYHNLEENLKAAFHEHLKSQSS
jgi:hypothetical protein